MYVPEHYRAGDVDALIERLARANAGILITLDPDGAPYATHMPILWDAAAQTATGHIARANPQHSFAPGRALIVLSGAEAYVSPSLYPSKAEHGKTVPTWNYEAVHLSGVAEWFDDAARLEGVVRALSDFHESKRAEPWSVDDAPRGYIDAMLRGIVGVAVKIDRSEAKRKLSQNKSARDFEGVMDGLETESPQVAALMHEICAADDDPDGN